MRQDKANRCKLNPRMSPQAQVETAKVFVEEWDDNRGGGHLRLEVSPSAPPLDPAIWSTIDARAGSGPIAEECY